MADVQEKPSETQASDPHKDLNPRPTKRRKLLHQIYVDIDGMLTSKVGKSLQDLGTTSESFVKTYDDARDPDKTLVTLALQRNLSGKGVSTPMFVLAKPFLRFLLEANLMLHVFPEKGSRLYKKKGKMFEACDHIPFCTAFMYHDDRTAKIQRHLHRRETAFLDEYFTYYESFEDALMALDHELEPLLIWDDTQCALTQIQDTHPEIKPDTKMTAYDWWKSIEERFDVKSICTHHRFNQLWVAVAENDPDSRVLYSQYDMIQMAKKQRKLWKRKHKVALNRVYEQEPLGPLIEKHGVLKYWLAWWKRPFASSDDDSDDDGAD
jgi:hypothetical protein